MKATEIIKGKSILLIFLCFSMQVFGQWKMPQDYPSPNAASLGLYGQIPVSGFTGTPDISIPLYTIQLRNFQLPIELRYHIGSIKPDVSPGWTGLGWTLTTGGSITRIIRGIRDETTGDDFYREKGGIQTGYNFGYYYNASILPNTSNWTTSAFLMNYSNASGGNYANANTDLEPDEFLFNFAGFSGSFFYNGKSGGKDLFKIKSQQPVDFNISWVIANTNPGNRENLEVFKKLSPKNFLLQSYISTITIIDQNGIKYEFGGSKDAIDFTTTPGYTNTITTAVTWYLTAITTPNGDKIQFKYKKEGDLFVNTRLRESLSLVSTQSGCSGSIYNIGSTGDAHLSILHLSYLSQITSSAGETIDFASSASEELEYTYTNTSPIPGIDKATFDKAILRNNGNYKLKLDTLSISNAKEKLKKFTFKYTNSFTKRLHLDTLKADQYKYVFKYNTTSLPVYNAKRSDNWGYYNDKSYDNTAYSALYQYRTPDLAKMKAETLEEIIYPTGGSTKFEYEAHTYSKIATLYSDPQNLFGLKNENGTAGGLRIRKIISRPNGASSAGEVVKEYFYTNLDNTSSGILSGIPVYETIMKQTDTGYSNTGYYQSENYINPLGNTNGAHVTYSRVIEKLSDGSSTVYYYTNHEDQKDESAAYGISNISYQSALIAPFSSKEAGRGLLKAEVHKNSGNVVLDSTYYEYKYPYDPFIKSVSRNYYPFYFAPYCVTSFETMFCYKQYACIPTLNKKTEVIYDISGKNPVTTTTNYSYNTKNLLSTTNFTRSDGKIQTTKFVYPFEITNNPDTAIFRKMTEKNLLSDYVEKIIYLGTNQVIDGEYRKFSETKANSGIFKPGRIDYLPKTAITLNSQSSYYQPEIYLSYDNWGNVKESKTVSGNITTTYIWGYNYQYPIAKIIGASYSDVTGKITEASLNTISTKSEPSTADYTTINGLRSSLPNAFVTTYSYKPFIGIEIMTDPKGIVTKYEYDSFGRLIKVIQADRKIESYDYHYKN